MPTPAPAVKKTTPPKKSARPGRTSRPNASRSSNASVDEIAFWASIKDSTNAEDFKAYLEQYPNGKFAALAKNRLKSLAAAKNTGTNSQPTVTQPTNTAGNASSQPVKSAGSDNTGSSPTNSSLSNTARPPNPPASLRSFDFVTATLDNGGTLKSRDRKSAYEYTEDLGGGVKLEMVAIPPGEFMMGSPQSQADRGSDEGPQHRVRINSWFYMGKFEVTQAQWRAVMGTNPSNFKDCDECPVEKVLWNDAVDFCRKLSARTGREYRLPSEAEWEYAARAGTTTPFAFGDTVTPEIVNYDGNKPYANAAKGMYRQKTVPAGSLGVANAFGLYDMHGNVWEWCQDWFHASYSAISGDAPTDGSAWLTGGEQKDRVLRGGSWDYPAFGALSASRGRYIVRSGRYKHIGFRVVAVR